MTELVACIGVILTEPNQNPPTVLAIENYASIVGLVDTYADAVAADAVRNHNPWRPIETAPKSNGSKHSWFTSQVTALVLLSVVKTDVFTMLARALWGRYLNPPTGSTSTHHQYSAQRRLSDEAMCRL